MEEIDESKDSADPAISAAESNVIEAFKHWHHLYHSFCTQSAVSEHDVAIDFEEMDHVFAAILYRVTLALSLCPLCLRETVYTLSAMKWIESVSRSQCFGIHCIP